MRTYLDAVNFLMGVMGSPPVGSLTALPLPPDVQICVDRLDDQTKGIQNHGYWFNTNLNVVLTPETSGEILVPSNTLKIKGLYGAVIQRGTKLFDREANSYLFTENICCHIIEELEWDLLPSSAREAAMYLAAVLICKIDLEDSTKAQDLSEFASQALMELKSDDVQIEQTSVYQRPQVKYALHRAQPNRSRMGNNPLYPGG